ncbi:MAG: hypothetical protein QXM71_07215 [Thermofilum sp.]
MVERYKVKQDDVEFEVVEVNLEPLYEFAPQVTACRLLRTLGEIYLGIREMLINSDILVEHSPDAGVDVWGYSDKDTAYALAWIIKESKEVGIEKAIEFVKQFTEFDEVKVRRLLERVLRVLVLWDGYEHCYAIRFKGVFGSS